MSKTTIHVFDEKHQYLGNIMYTYSIPYFTEEELVAVIINHFPHLKGKKWSLIFN